MSELIVRGGTVVTAERSFRADVAIRDGRITEVGAGLAAALPAARTRWTPAACWCCPAASTSTPTRGCRRTRSRIASTRTAWRRPSAARPPSWPSTTRAPASASRGARRCWPAWTSSGARTDGESAVDFALSAVISGQQADPVAELPELIARGVPTAKAFMVYDFRLPDERLFAALQVMGRHGGMLQVHCENATIIDALVAGALDAGQTECRHHAACRPTYAEAEATHRAIALAQAADASVYVVHLSCADALAEVVAAKARGWPVYAETCPHYLSRTDAAYEADDEAEVIKSVISPPLRSRVRSTGAVAGTGARRAGPGRHRPRAGPAGGREGGAGAALPADQQRRAGDRDAAQRGLQHRAWQPGGSRWSAWSTCWPPRRRGCSACAPRAPWRSGVTPTWSCSTRTRRARSGQADLHHTSDFTPYEGMRGPRRGADGAAARERRSSVRACSWAGGGGDSSWSAA